MKKAKFRERGNNEKNLRAHLYVTDRDRAFFEDSFPNRPNVFGGELVPSVQQEKQSFPCADFIGYPFVDRPPDVLKIFVIVGSVIFEKSWRC